MVVYRALQRLT